MKLKYLPLLIVLFASCKKEMEDKLAPKISTSLTITSSSPTLSKDLEWMVDLIDKERESNPVQALDYATKLIEASRFHKDKLGEGIGYYKRAYIQDQHLGEYGKAYQDYFEASTIFEELNLHNSVSDCYLGIGGVFYKLGEYKDALNSYQQLLQNAEQVNNKVDQAIAYRAMALCYRELGENISHVILFYEKALKLREELQDNAGIADCYYGIATTYYNLKNDYVKAKEYYLKTLDIYKTEDNQLSIFYFDLGLTYKELKEDKTALDYFSKAALLAEKLNYSRIMIRAHQEFGMIYLAKKDYVGALVELQAAEEIATQAKDNVLLAEIKNLIMNCYSGLGNLQKALSYAKTTNQLESVNSSNNLTATLKQNQQIDEIRKFQTSFKKEYSFDWKWIAIASSILLALIGYIILSKLKFSSSILRKEKELLEEEINEYEKRIEEVTNTLLGMGSHMIYQSNELKKLQTMYNGLVDDYNKLKNRRNDDPSDDEWLNDQIHPN